MNDIELNKLVEAFKEALTEAFKTFDIKDLAWFGYEPVDITEHLE
jgi:hypothetical protein